MPLDDNAKAENIVGSVQEYFQNSLADVLNSSQSAVDYGGGMPFRDDDLSSWVQLRLIAPTRPESLSGPFAEREGKRGQELRWLLNLNCFVRPALLSPFSNLKIWRVRDMALGPLMVGTRIAVKDYTGTLETIGYLFIDAIMEDRAVQDPLRTELLQHNLVLLLRWTETWTA
jgi:hypothetical protein